MMRLTERFTRKVTLYKPEKVESDYVGTELALQPIGEISADIQDAESKLMIMQYGSKVSRMKIAYTTAEGGKAVREGFVIELDSKLYKVISVKNRIRHCLLTLEEDDYGYTGRRT